jgi:hypothetical protein
MGLAGTARIGQGAAIPALTAESLFLVEAIVSDRRTPFR